MAFREIRLFGERRDSAVAECRVLVNTHFHDDYTVLETIRTNAALVSGVIVVSEHSVHSELTSLEQHIVFCHTTEIEDAVRQTLSRRSEIRASLLNFLSNGKYEESVYLPHPFLEITE